MITEFKDIKYTVQMTIGTQNNCYVDFEVYEIIGFSSDKPIYQNRSDADSTNGIENAEWIVRGSIKWDACANIEFSNCVHFCGPIGAKNFGSLMTRLFDLAYEMMPTTDEGMFEKQLGDK